MKQLLIVAHAPSENTRVLANAVLRGAQHADINGVQSRMISPFECDPELVLIQDALILFTTENFGYMSGALKDFFDRVYYPCLADSAKNDGKPFALIIRAGIDGSGTDTAVHKITTGLKWREVQAPLLCKGNYNQTFIKQCHELGTTMAAGLENEIF